MLASVTVALLSLMPELAAVFKYGNKWTPVNFPLRGRGDDYHHYSILNKLDYLIFLKKKPRLIAKTFANSTLIQMPGYLLMFIPFKIISSISNKKFGVLATRWICRTFFFYLGTRVIFSYLEDDLSNQTKSVAAFTTIILLFIVYPGFTGSSITNSALWGLLRNSKIVLTGSLNEFCRGFVLELTAPLLFGYILVANNSNTIKTSDIALMIGLNIILVSCYPPIGVVLCLIIAVEFHDYSNIQKIALILINSITVCFSTYYMKIDKVGKEIFAISKNSIFKQLRDIPSKKLAYFSVDFLIMTITLLVLTQAHVLSRIYFLLLAFFSLTVLANHNLERIWQRSGILIYNLIISIWVAHLIIHMKIMLIVSAFVFILLSAILIKETIEAIKNKTFASWGDKLELLEKISSNKSSNKLLLVTADPELTFWNSLYGSYSTMWECYFLTRRGYIENIESYLLACEKLGHSNSSLSTEIRINFEILNFMLTYHPYNTKIKIRNSNELLKLCQKKVKKHSKKYRKNSIVTYKLM